MRMKTASTNPILFSLALLCLGALVPRAADGATCTTQQQMTASQRDALAAASRALLTQVQSGDLMGLRDKTIPSVAADFDGIAASVNALKPLIQSAAITVDQLYDLDASTEPANSPRTDFFCGSPVVVLNLNNLPPGKYALAILHATGVAQPQQVSFILGRTADNRWQLGGVFSKPMIEAGHDGLWYWVAARKYSQANEKWNAWFYYQLASDLLDPVQFLSSPNLQKLQHETEQVRPANLPGDKPLTMNADGTVFQITSIGTTSALGSLDLEIHYAPDTNQSAELRDGSAARRQVVEVMTAILGAHPELQRAFHGVWVHADQGDASLFALELPMTSVAAGSSQPAANPVVR